MINEYRPDIDGLRTIAVFSVLFFHASFLPLGYLGVDIFFVISGFLITKIIWSEIQQNTFTISRFYERRIRRIIPMVVLILLCSFFIGYFFMLPDDFENLSQSIIATTFFSNNILIYLTSGYWNIANEYKPLLHTWSLGVEEQFYFVYPIILLILAKFTKKNSKAIVLLVFLILVSLLSNFIIKNPTFNFFSVTSRFWQLSLGGLITLIDIQKIKNNNKVFFNLVSNIVLAGLIGVLFIQSDIFFNKSGIVPNIIVCAFTAIIIALNSSWGLSKILRFQPIVFLGKLSFSIYLWHQLLYVLLRINTLETPSLYQYLICIGLTIILSFFSYTLVENYFRKKDNISRNKLYITLSLFTILTLALSFTVYLRAGVVKDYPELDMYANVNHSAGEQAQYNDRIYKLDKEFVTTNNHKNVLVIGNSYGRDFINMLYESKIQDTINISYIYAVNYNYAKYSDRINAADLIIVGAPTLKEDGKYVIEEDGFIKMLNEIKQKNKDKQFLFLGVKNFGKNSNVFFNKYDKNSRCKVRIDMQEGYYELNNALSVKLGDEYINLVNLIKDTNNKIPVFTNDCKLISQDCEHLTKAGAQYMGSLLLNDLSFRKKLFMP